MNPFLYIVVQLIDLYFYVVLAAVIMSWLTAFNVINSRNQFVGQVGYALHRLTEPLLGPIRRYLPDLGGLDISPIVLLLAMQFVRYFVIYYGMRFL
jgi:YggT family protein